MANELKRRIGLLEAVGDLAGECLIPGMKRISGHGCVMHQVWNHDCRRILTDNWFNRKRVLNARFMYCRDCRHFLSDAEAIEAKKWVARRPLPGRGAAA